MQERFAVAYAALELAKPDAAGNGSSAYRVVAPKSALKTAQNQAKTWLDRPEVRARVDALMLEATGADHIVHAGVWIDNLLLKAATLAEQQEDAATLGRLGELLDRGRVGGPRFIKETRSRKVGENPFTGKSAEEIRAMKQAARELLRGEDAEHADRHEVGEDPVGDGGRGRDPVH